MKASDNPYPSILIAEGTEPTAPAAGHQRLYIDSTTHHLKRTDSSGTDVDLETAGAGNVATDAIWDAAGDLAVGTGANTAARLAIGTPYQIPRVNSGATALEYAGGMTLVSEITAGAVQASIDFTSIPGTGRHLVIEAIVRGTKAAAYDDFRLRFNNDSGANYDSETHIAYSTSGASAQALAGTGATVCQAPAASAAANLVSTCRIFIAYYADTNWRRIARVEASEVTAESSGSIVVRRGTAHWRSTAAITQVTLYFSGGNVAQNSRASLYIAS